MKAKDTEIQELVSQTIANDGETDKYQHIIKLKDQEVNTLKNKLKVTRDDLIGLTKAHRNCSLVKEELGWTKVRVFVCMFGHILISMDRRMGC